MPLVAAIVRPDFVARLGETVSRFPLPLVSTLLAFLVYLGLYHDVAVIAWLDDGNFRAFFFCIIAFFLALAVDLAGERRDWLRLSRLLLFGIGLGVLGVRVFTMPRAFLLVDDITMFFLLPALVLLVMVAPYRSGDGAAAFWNFNRASWLAAAFALLASILLGLGLMAAYWAIESLLGVDMPHWFASHSWAFCLTLLWPFLALSRLPRDVDEDSFIVPWGVKVLAEYILVPLAMAYLAIVYLYIVKILVQWALPDGEIAYFVGTFLVFAIVTNMIVFPLGGTGGWLTRFFHHRLYLFLPVPIMLLGIAIWNRVDAYGVTEARYGLALIAVWLAIITAYFLVRPKGLLPIIPITLSALLLGTSFGPWGAMSVSTRSQFAHLESVLASNGMLVDGRARPAQGSVTIADARRISSIVAYFAETGKLAVLAPLLQGRPLDLARRPSANQIVADLGISFLQDWEREPSFYFRLPHDDATDISGFDVLVRLEIQPNELRPEGIDLDPGPGKLSFRRLGQQVEIGKEQGGRVTFDIADLVMRLQSQEAGSNLRPHMILNGDSGGLRVRLQFESLQGQITDRGPHVQYGQALVLIASDSAPRDDPGPATTGE